MTVAGMVVAILHVASMSTTVWSLVTYSVPEMRDVTQAVGFGISLLMVGNCDAQGLHYSVCIY